MKTFIYTTKHKTMLGDLHTPVSTYLKVRDIFPQSALMESSDYHGSENNRSALTTESPQPLTLTAAQKSIPLLPITK